MVFIFWFSDLGIAHTSLLNLCYNIQKKNLNMKLLLFFIVSISARHYNNYLQRKMYYYYKTEIQSVFSIQEVLYRTLMEGFFMGVCLVYGLTALIFISGIFAVAEGNDVMALLSFVCFGGFVFMILKAKLDVADGTYERQKEEERRRIEQERIYAEQSQHNGAPWGERYYTYPCPYCGHYKVRPANWDDKRMSVAFWGAASSKIGDKYKCENCNRTWK